MRLIAMSLELRLMDLVTALLAGLILAVVTKGYNLGKKFLRNQHDRNEQLDTTSKMVDRHTLALRKAGILGPVAGRVYHGGRRRNDHVVDILSEEEPLST